MKVSYWSRCAWCWCCGGCDITIVQSILMYASSPVHIHIICDEAAQTYLEERLALVTRPKYDFLVRFYRPSYQDMLDRVEREGSLATIHSAGVGMLLSAYLLPPA